MATDDQALTNEKIQAEIGKLIAESSKLNAQAAKILAEVRWYPFVATAGLFAAATAFVKLVLH